MMIVRDQIADRVKVGTVNFPLQCLLQFHPHNLKMIKPWLQGRCRRGARGVRTTALLKTAGDNPHKFGSSVSFFWKRIRCIFAFSNIFKIKWPISEENLNFWGRWVWVPIRVHHETMVKNKMFDDTLLGV